VNALLRIMQSGPMPIHMVCRCFERTFKLPFRAFRQPSFVEFLSQHPQAFNCRCVHAPFCFFLCFLLWLASPLVLAWQFQILDAYVAPAGGPMHFPPPMGAGPRYRRTVSDPASLCLTDAVTGAQIGSNLRARAEISSGGGRYYALCDAIEEQDVVIWR